MHGRMTARLSMTLSMCLFTSGALAGPARYRVPAPAEDSGPQIEEPTFGRAAGHRDSDGSLGVMEWVAKRAWYTLGLSYERKDFMGPPAMKLEVRPGQSLEIAGTLALGGVPLRNQVISCDIEQRDQPVLVALRSTDAFGELLIELDLRGGKARLWSNTVSRSMIGGQSHSSPMPEQACSQLIAKPEFAPVTARTCTLKLRTQGAEVIVRVDDRELFRFTDPDPAGGRFGLGSVGTVVVRDIQQWELISPQEKQRRVACMADMHAFSQGLDAEYEGDVRQCNRVEPTSKGVRWMWPATGATAEFAAEPGRLVAKVRAGLYGNDLLADGAYPEVEVTASDGAVFQADAQRVPDLQADALGLHVRWDLKDEQGRRAVADVRARFTVQTVWFWTVSVEGVTPRAIRAGLDLAPAFTPAAGKGTVPANAKDYLRHNARAGLYIKAIEPANTSLASAGSDSHRLIVSTSDAVLRFASVVLPAQPLNPVGFTRRMVHYIRYPEGPIQNWRRRPSFQEYPDDVDLARFRSHGTDAMVWHHTWLNTDFRDREAWLLNEPEMKRAMAETHRLGMTAVGYIGIVPGRSSLLGIEDLNPQHSPPTLGTYEKNWDLQDFTFYNVGGRIQEFLPWMADYWCKEYGLDGFYIDGALAGSSVGAAGPLRPEDRGLSAAERLHRLYYRVKKVFERNRAGFGLEAWGGLNWMLNGFYDAIMIGESFQEAPPDYYRDGNNALLTGCCIKMYGMRATSQNPYNVAMAALNLSDIQVCSGNGAWGDDPDTAETWARVQPLWNLLDTIRWDHLIEARPWYAQELVSGEGFYAANYSERDRVLVLLASMKESVDVEVRIDRSRLPGGKGVQWSARWVYGQSGELGVWSGEVLRVHLPALHDGPIGLELVRTSK